MKTKLLILFTFLFSVFLLNAEIKVASVLGDNMVLQRNSEVRLWGKGSPSEKLSITTSWNKVKTNAVCNEKGEWLVKVKTTEGGGPYIITIASAKEKVMLKNILLGEVWVCSGQSNMEMPINGFNGCPINHSLDFIVDGDNDNIRMFTVQKKAIGALQNSCGGKWTIASSATVGQFSAVGYLFAKQLQQKLKVPVGMLNTNWGGTYIEAWMDSVSIAKFPEALARHSKREKYNQNRASNLFNGMISPILNYTIKGAIWYQGENNRYFYKDYAAEMEELVAGWRKDFGVGQFPFYFVQIAPYNYGNSKETSSALLREAQLKASLAIPNCGMVSTIDIGNEVNIHPSEKLTVAKRLIYWALSKTYGIGGISCENTIYKSLVVQDSTALLSFDNIGRGFAISRKEIDNLEIAGADQVFYPAKASIVKYGLQLKVWSSQVPKPVAVRYAFHNFPQGKYFLYNVSGLPISSFRTDDWNK
jgi:sialate O-acetylesterase